LILRNNGDQPVRDSNMVYFLDSTDYIRIDSSLRLRGTRKQLSAGKKMLLSPAGMVLQGTFTSDP
jgi:hypothetical protein